MRKCKTCPDPATSSRHLYCDRCRRRRKRHKDRVREAKRVRATPTQRGYGTAHQKLRKEWARIVEAGHCRCTRCGLPIVPGSPWDLGHHDVDRSLYTGPEHRSCNRATAGRRKQRRSRIW